MADLANKIAKYGSGSGLLIESN